MFDGGMIPQWIFRAEPYFLTNPHSNIIFPSLSIAFNFDVSVVWFLRGHVRFLRTRRQAAQPKVAKVLVSVGLTGSPAETIGGSAG